MRACIHETYGGPEVLRLEEVAKPAPGDNELLIRTHATTVTSADWRALSLDLPLGFGLVSRLLLGVTRPRQPTLGTEIAGRVESVGQDVSRFDGGDEVFASAGGMGCHAEYKCMPEDGAVVHRPANLTWGEAAALAFGGTTALVFFKKAKLRKGERVLVNGASGAVGTAAVQIASHFGADVTGVCSGRNAELVKSLGANRVIDYTSEDFTENGEIYDVIIDTVGTAPDSRSKDSLRERGRLLLVLADLPHMLPIPWVALTSSRKIIAGPALPNVKDLRFLAAMAEAGLQATLVCREQAQCPPPWTRSAVAEAACRCRCAERSPATRRSPASSGGAPSSPRPNSAMRSNPAAAPASDPPPPRAARAGNRHRARPCQSRRPRSRS